MSSSEIRATMAFRAFTGACRNISTGETDRHRQRPAERVALVEVRINVEYSLVRALPVYIRQDTEESARLRARLTTEKW